MLSGRRALQHLPRILDTLWASPGPKSGESQDAPEWKVAVSTRTMSRPEEELPSTSRRWFIASGATHLLIGFLVFFSPRLNLFHSMPRTIPEPPLFLGYLGPTHYSDHIDELQANAMRSYLFRAPQNGVQSTRHRVQAEQPAQSRGAPAQQLDRAHATKTRSTPSPDGARPMSRVDGAAGTHGEGGVSTDNQEADPPIQEPGLQPDVPFSEQFVILKLVKPTYPEYELQHRISGRVIVALRITAEGEVGEARVQEATADPAIASTRSFELTAIEALQQWRLQLPKQYQLAEGYWIRVPVEFELDDPGFSKPVRLSTP